MPTAITHYTQWLARLDYNMKDVMRGAAAAFSLRVLGAVLGFGFNVLLARLSGAEGVGIYYLAVTVTGIAMAVGQLGLDNALLRFTAANAAQANWIGVAGVYRKGLWIAMGVSVLVTALVLGSAPWIAQVVFSEPALVKPLRLMALAILPLSLIALYSGLLKGLEKIWSAMLVESVGIPLLGLPLLALLGWAFGVNGAAAALVISSVFVLSVGVALWRRAAPQARGLVGQFDTRLLITTSLPLFWIALMNFIMSRTDMFLLGIWQDSEWVGIYGVAKRVSDLVVFILVAVNSIAASKFAALYAQGDFRALDSLARNTTKLMIVLAAPVLSVFVFVPSWVLGVFGPDFRAGATVLAILATGQFVNVATGSVGYLLMMTGHEKLMRNNIIACTILSVALSAILIPRHGVLGAALATAVSLAAMSLVSFGLVYWKLSIVTLPIPRRLFTYGKKLGSTPAYHQGQTKREKPPGLRRAWERQMTGKDEISSLDISIIIVNWNAKDRLRDCLSSIYEKTLGIPFEVIVADNASSDGSLDMVHSEFPQVKLLSNSENIGFARANNLALQAAVGRHIGLLNPDTVLLNDAFTMMVSKLENEPQIGVVGPRLLSSGDRLDYQCARNLISLRSEFERILGLGADNGLRTPLGNFLPLAEYNNSQEVDCISGACMLMRRDVLSEGRIFDPRFFMYAEDVDLCYEIVQNGWKVFYLSEAHVLHSRRESPGHLSVSADLYSMRANYQFFVKRRGYLAGYMYRLLWVIVTMGKLAITWLVRLSPRFRHDPTWMKRGSVYPQMIRYALRFENHQSMYN